MQEFTVDTDALANIASTFHSLSDDMNSARQQIRSIDAGSFGNAKVQQATVDFVNHWDHQSQRLGTELDSFASSMDTTVATYATTETQLSTGLAKMVNNQ